MDELKELLKALLGLLLIAAVAFLLGLGYGRRTARIEPETTIIERVDSVTVHDTITRYKPVFVASHIHDTVRTYFTTVRHDTVEAVVPIEVRVYAEDSLYRAVVSGWRPSLDSLVLFPKTTTITIREKVKTPPPKLSLGVTAGPSALVTPQGKIHAGLGATVGLQYRF